MPSASNVGAPSILAIIFGRIGMPRADQGVATNRDAAKASFVLAVIGIGLIIWIAAVVSSTSNF